MSTNGQLLHDVIQALHKPGDLSKQREVLGTAVHLLTELTSSHNVSILASQLLQAPTVLSWDSAGTPITVPLVQCFRAAAMNKAREDNPQVTALRMPRWLDAVKKGIRGCPADKQLAALCGIYCGLQMTGSGSRQLRDAEEAFCVTLNLVLTTNETNESAASAVLYCMSQSLPHLSEQAQRVITWDSLLSVSVRGIYCSGFALGNGDFMKQTIGDTQILDGRVHWPTTSRSFERISALTKMPFYLSMGPYANVAASAAARCHDSRSIKSALVVIDAFSSSLRKAWENSPFSKVHQILEKEHFSEETTTSTTPLLWHVLKRISFATSIILHAAISNFIQSSATRNKAESSRMASFVVQIMHNLYFITARIGGDTVATYDFTFRVALDIICQRPGEADKLLTEMAPSVQPETIYHPINMSTSLFFLNMSEHLAPVISPLLFKEIVFPVAQAYMKTPVQVPCRPLFEAAHSVVLALIMAPQMKEMASEVVVGYAQNTLTAFPGDISPRQLSLAFATLVQATAQPAPLYAKHPELSEHVLDLLLQRAGVAHIGGCPVRLDDGGMVDEKSACLLAYADSLPHVAPENMIRRLELLAGEVGKLAGEERRRLVDKLWNVIACELDVAKSELAVYWWHSFGGKDKTFIEERSNL